MSRPELRSFQSADVRDAGRVLAASHARHCRAEPLLDARLAEPEAAAEQVHALWQGEGSSGAVALVDGHLTGYLIGREKAVDQWGPNTWVDAGGHAVDGDAEIARDLYGFAAADWAERGRTAHYVVVPASEDAVVNAWFRLGFGLQHVHAIRYAGVDGIRGARVPEVSVRRARADDIVDLVLLDVVLPEHQARSPVFSTVPVSDPVEARQEWTELLGDDDFALFVAERDELFLGAAIGCPIEKSGLHAGVARPDAAAFLGFAAVLPRARGLGAGRALGEAVLAWAAAEGFHSVVTDWRATNLPSSRTWPQLGFHETFLRLHRVIGY